MAGLGPAIHDFGLARARQVVMPGPRPGMTLFSGVAGESLTPSSA